MNKYERGKPLVSIIIPSWFTNNQNGKYGENETFWFANKCLIRLVESTPRDKYELIVIDNGSDLYLGPDNGDIDTESYFHNDNIDILIRNKTNLGFAPAINQGIAMARGKYVVCLNNDILVWPGWLDAMLLSFMELLSSSIAEDTNGPGAIMPALMKNTRDAREALKIKDLDLRSNFDKYHPGAEFGALFMMPMFIVDKLIKMDGYFLDENFKLGFGEDRDLWDRIRAIGYQTYRSHKTRVYHQGNMSIGKIDDRREYINKNREYLLNKRKDRNEKNK